MEWLIVAGGLQVAGSIWGAQAAADAMEEQARIAAIQAQIAMVQSKFAAEVQLKAGREEAGVRRRESRRASGGAVAAVAGAGLELSGSPLVLIGERIRLDELNAARVITNAHARASSERAAGRGAAAGFTAQAASLEAQADVTRTAGFLDAIGRGLSAAGGYYAMTRGGGGGGNISRPSAYPAYGGGEQYYQGG